LCAKFDFPSEYDPLPVRIKKITNFFWLMATQGRTLQRWMQTTIDAFATRFKDPLICQGLLEMWIPEFSIFFMLATLAYLHNRNAGYPIGGSLPMSLAMEKRYLALGGVIHYRSRVEKILVESNRAVGVRLTDGSEHFAERVISAADGHATIFELLDGKYADAKTREPYEKWKTFQPLIYIGLGVRRTFENEPRTVSGISFPLCQPVEIGDAVRDRLTVHLYNHDDTLAPAGKTSLVVMMPSDYDYWKALSKDRVAYTEKKEQIARTVVTLLEQRFPGISQQVEMVDVATPLTFEHYTGNWKGSFEGWLITPQNAGVMMSPMLQTLPGLQNFFMCGQWVEPGGGLPTGVMSARRLVRALCKEDGKKFQTRIEV
ncbi:MAG: NAD(P)/FAD-dependent oxidoreductase, partial [Anaerolineales bacterium]